MTKMGWRRPVARDAGLLFGYLTTVLAMVELDGVAVWDVVQKPPVNVLSLMAGANPVKPPPARPCPPMRPGYCCTFPTMCSATS